MGRPGHHARAIVDFAAYRSTRLRRQPFLVRGEAGPTAKSAWLPQVLDVAVFRNPSPTRALGARQRRWVILHAPKHLREVVQAVRDRANFVGNPVAGHIL